MEQVEGDRDMEGDRMVIRVRERHWEVMVESERIRG